MGKILIIAGVILIVVGVLVSFSDRIPFFGKLPGDFSFESDKIQILFPAYVIDYYQYHCFGHSLFCKPNAPVRLRDLCFHVNTQNSPSPRK